MVRWRGISILPDDCNKFSNTRLTSGSKSNFILYTEKEAISKLEKERTYSKQDSPFVTRDKNFIVDIHPYHFGGNNHNKNQRNDSFPKSEDIYDDTLTNQGSTPHDYTSGGTEIPQGPKSTFTAIS